MKTIIPSGPTGEGGGGVRYLELELWDETGVHNEKH